MIGVVQSGFGAAQRDVTNGVYERLGEMYPGSLNLKVERGALTEWGEPDLIIPGPECRLWVWKGLVRTPSQYRSPVWVMHPCRWPSLEYASLVELFASVRLRDLLGVEDGDEVEVTR